MVIRTFKKEQIVASEGRVLNENTGCRESKGEEGAWTSRVTLRTLVHLLPLFLANADELQVRGVALVHLDG